LIEMMVVVAIIAILALIALPNGQDKYIRAQISEALSLADIAKGPIAAHWSAAHTMLPDNTSAGLPAPDKVVNNFVRALAIQDGAIHITFGNRAHALIKDKTLTLRPAVIEDAPVVPVAWVCGNASAPDKMTIRGENKTDISANFLPVQCR
jgi:type IV pilus assembly protein PilA